MQALLFFSLSWKIWKSITRVTLLDTVPIKHNYVGFFICQMLRLCLALHTYMLYKGCVWWWVHMHVDTYISHVFVFIIVWFPLTYMWHASLHGNCRKYFTAKTDWCMSLEINNRALVFWKTSALLFISSDMHQSVFAVLHQLCPAWTRQEASYRNTHTQRMCVWGRVVTIVVCSNGGA